MTQRDKTQEGLSLFKEFLVDETIVDGAFNHYYLRGRSGTGKTTLLNKFCALAEELGYQTLACAHTHKACDVLEVGLPSYTQVQTLHSFLTKRPTINHHATSVRHLENSVMTGEADEVYDLIMIDEYGVVNENDSTDLEDLVKRANLDRAKLIAEGEEGVKFVKIVYAGDVLQLEAVEGKCSIQPKAPYDLKLTKQWRSQKGLGVVVNLVADYIEGIKKPAPLPTNIPEFIRGEEDLVTAYNGLGGSKFLLAYTNARVQELNAEVQGAVWPVDNDKLFSPSMNDDFTLLEQVSKDYVTTVNKRWGEDKTMELGSKYKTLEFLLTMPEIEFYRVEDSEGTEFLYPAMFGTKNFLQRTKELQVDAVNTNAAIVERHGVETAAPWARANYSDPLARDRAKAWRMYLTFKELVHSFDFTHARTVHKSQGSTVDNVVLDTDDLGQCKRRDFDLYMRLFYVGIGRARYTVTTN